MTIYFAPEAEADFAAVVGYLVERNPVAASELAANILRIVDRLADNEFDGPEQTLVFGRGRPELAGPARAHLLPTSLGRVLGAAHLSSSAGADRSIALRALAA